ncbi:MAG: hypothetical protein A2431_02200 [Candidatus Zambryskibacteria bacterium RIFOXYC1_FULL_39_10]|uniref:Uncharacterized protein n=1 Tax=Candidatus Zambryskibacteria bacterium RIFOXYC1_FULL_39_10 TaxID=1802779 RepID=A0A1G2V3H2_9BACT|nr:MAG: hypothetical protein A2431_02200 [Candidatus Zambryskibacteria bacterium RIFOXYC1_FULL_39_10]OHB16728.1 MAG: hypothetical protein A2605_01050 [Candidatus Zambryskibacteria bacterium RIFOXYD1_FULL_39_35]
MPRKIIKNKITKKEQEQFKIVCFYMANLGSEVQRIFSWKEKGDKETMQNAYKRATLIIDKIKSFNNESANAEMDILQKFFDELILEKMEYSISRNQISSYFNPFALRVINSL